MPWVQFGGGHEEGSLDVPEMGDAIGFPIHETCPWFSQWHEGFVRQMCICL